MKPDQEIFDLLKKARRSIQAAEVLLKEGLDDFSASRSYYAMFYVAEAILLTKDLSFSSHKAVAAAFGKEFIKTGELPSNLHGYLRDAFRLRQAGDYGSSLSFRKEDAQSLIAQAKEFISTVEEYLRNKGYNL